MPDDARTDSAGLRWYRWTPADGSEPTDVLSVTSIRKACGVNNNLVNWQLGNLVTAATGTRVVERVGPRGGVKKVYQPDGEFPGEFVRRLIETEGAEEKIKAVRGWLRKAADEPRDAAAIRGTVVHKALEEDALSPDAPWIATQYRNEARSRDRAKAPEPTDDDVMFIRRSVGQYRAFREDVPFVILAREPQLWNLSLGYAGSADVIGYLVTPFDIDYYHTADAIAEAIARGDTDNLTGTFCILDYKTAAGIYTDNVLQVTGYLACEFAGSGGVVDEYVTNLLPRLTHGGLLHIRPDGWSLHMFPFRHEVMQAYAGSVMLARFLADYDRADHLFSDTKAGRAAA